MLHEAKESNSTSIVINVSSIFSCTTFPKEKKVMALVTSSYLPPKGIGFYSFSKISVSLTQRGYIKSFSIRALA
jgi:hypothetical protein